MPNMDLERRSKSKNGSQSAPCSGPKILVKSGGCPAKYCQVESNVVSELNASYTVGAVRNETLVFVNFSAQDASILKISVPIIKRRS